MGGGKEERKKIRTKAKTRNQTSNHPSGTRNRKRHAGLGDLVKREDEVQVALGGIG